MPGWGDPPVLGGGHRGEGVRVAREPDEHPNSGGTGGADAFDAIVSGWQREGAVPQWPADDTDPLGPLDDHPAADDPALPADDPEPSDASGVPVRPSPTTATPDPAEDHFVPPEPPPLPRLGPPAIVGLALIALGLVLAIVPHWLGVPDTYGLPLGLVALAAGLGWLVLRLWPTPPPPGHDGDDGAVL